MTAEQQAKLGLGMKEKLAVWLLYRWLNRKGIMNLKNYGVGDYLKLVANASAAAAVGYAQGGYIGAALSALIAVAALLQAPPGKDAVAK